MVRNRPAPSIPNSWKVFFILYLRLLSIFFHCSSFEPSCYFDSMNNVFRKTLKTNYMGAFNLFMGILEISWNIFLRPFGAHECILAVFKDSSRCILRTGGADSSESWSNHWDSSWWVSGISPNSRCNAKIDNSLLIPPNSDEAERYLKR